MDFEPSIPTQSKATLRCKRLLALLLCELMILQPTLATAGVTQVPLFTVTSVPPNVLLTFDDSASMQLLTLTPPAPFDDTTSTPPSLYYPTTPVASRLPVLKINTQGYFGISGMKWYFAGDTTYDNRWNFGAGEVRWRSPAFNPLAYNPAVQYQPWNNNGVRMPNASYGGNGDVASGALTEWDKRNLPASMGGGTVAAKTGSNTGNIPNVSPATLRSWVGPPAGSVRYQGLAMGPATPVAATAPVNVDLFDHTIVWTNPSCTTPTTNYNWTCSAGTAAAAALDTCGSGNVGGMSASGTCCTATSTTNTTTFTTGLTRNKEFGFNLFPPPGPAPVSPTDITGLGGETCTSVTFVATNNYSYAPSCVTPPQQIAPCPGGGGELCVIQPPDVCGTAPKHTWKCTYDGDVTTSTTTCTATIAKTCSASAGACGGFAALDPTTDAKYSSGYWPPARYVVYDGPASRTTAEVQDLSNYRMIMISRKFGWNGVSRTLTGTNVSNAVSKWFVVDGVTGLPSYRPDCDAPPAGTGNAGQDGTWCTFEQEAQNYANWYTYYRSRLFAAIGVVSEVLSGFTGPEQYMRLGFGRINYFKGALNPWNVNSVSDIPHPASLPNLDGQANSGAVELGVRSFTVFDPPLSGSPNVARQTVFDRLFAVNGLGPTPNRETMHAIGRYFTRTDSAGPWGLNPGSGAEPAADHLWCRRNYTVLATDGEWTKLPTTLGFKPQPLLENSTDWSIDPATLGVTTSMGATGTTINGTERLTGAALTFDYVPANEPQITGGSGTQTGTLTDVMHYYWSHDLRTDLRNSIDSTPNNRAFWQHMSSYVVGYGVNASMESSTLRTDFRALTTIAWPTVGLEACRQLDDNTADTALDSQRQTACVHSVTPSGNRINDTLRGALAGSGDFFSANSPGQLRASLDAVFAAINAENASGTAPSFSSPNLTAGSLLVQSGFFTNTWEGYVQAFDAKAYVQYLNGVGALPPLAWSANFLGHASRPIFTSSAQATAVAFDWCNLNAAQQADLDPVYAGANTCPVAAPPLLPYLRGDATFERRNGGTYRDRRNTVLGDVVNSSPVHSKGEDSGYRFGPAASYSASGTDGFVNYPSYVIAKKTSRMPIAMFGANDGMFHILDAQTGQATSGREIFAYVPRAVYSQLRQLSDPTYTHRYFVDGPIVQNDIWNGSVWKTIAVGSTGAGGRGLFAIDISEPQLGFTASNVLWDITAADHPSANVRDNLGLPIGAGILGSVRHDADSNATTKPNGRWALVTGNGYESTNNRAVLLVLDATDGSLIRAIDTGVGSVGSPNGLGAVSPVYDANRDIVAVYAGDKLGNLWKFDLSSSNPTNWKIFNEFPAGTAQPLYATTSGGVNRTIHQAPRITQHPLGGLYVAVGTGKFYDVGDPGTTEDEGIFVIWDQGKVPPLAFSDLQLIRTDEYTNAGNTFRRLYASDLSSYDWNDKGFWIRLRTRTGPPTGERIIAPLILDGGTLIATSFNPENGTDPCIPGGSSVHYRLDLTGSFSSPQFVTEGATSIGIKQNPGTAGGLSPTYIAVDPGALIVHTMTAADVKTLLANPKYRSSANSGSTSVDQNRQGPTGDCTDVGLRVDGTVAAVKTTCSGYQPLRMWRPMR